jgi:acyl-CoA thioesterase II
MASLEQDTRLSGDDGRFTAQLSRAWEIWGPNGGYLAAIALRAAGKLAKIPRPVSLHVHYLRPARFEEVGVHVQVLQSGRSAESLAVNMEQGGKPVLTALVRTATPCEGLVHRVVEAPEVVAPAEAPDSESLRLAEHPRFPFWENFDRRVLQPESWARPRAALPPRWLEWLRYRTPVPSEDAFLQAARSAILIDTMCWPAAWLHHAEERFIAPSLDLTVWFHAPTPSDWLLVDARADVAEAGLIGGTARVWSEQGALIASGGSQLLCMPVGR